MPAALDVNWEAVKMLAIQTGVREAARRMGLNENAVMQRSAREGWLRDLPRSQPLPPSVRKAVSNVSNAPQAAVNYLKDTLLTTRTNHAKVALIASGELLNRAQEQPAALLDPEAAQTLLTHAKHAALAGGWADQAPTAKLSLSIVAGQDAQPMTLDAEFTEMQPVEDDPLAGF